MTTQPTRLSDRVVLFRASVGSHNYNLNTPTSDKDYKAFVLPTFDDLFSGIVFAKSIVTETEDNDVHDVRKLVNLFYKSNINFMETLFANEFYVPNDELHDAVTQIYIRRDDIARINLPYFFNACVGMHTTKKKQSMANGALDTKAVMTAWRVLDFLERFHKNEFNSCGNALRYHETDPVRQFLLDMKSGTFKTGDVLTPDMATKMLDDKLESAKALEPVYCSFEPDDKLKDKLESMLKDIVWENLVRY